MDPIGIIPIGIIVFILFCILCFFNSKGHKKAVIRKKAENILTNCDKKKNSVQEFFYERKELIKSSRNHITKSMNYNENNYNDYINVMHPEERELSSKVSGVYILHNTTKNIYYVGQAVSLWQRVNNHFIGKGNGDVYADYKYSSNFTITLVRCDIKNLNKVEVFYIHKYNAHLMGYNKTPGNYGI